MANVVSIDIDLFFESVTKQIKNRIERQVIEYAKKIAEEEVAKLAISVSEFVSIRDLEREVVITIRKETK